MFTRLNRIIVVGSIVLAFLGAIYHSFATKLSEERALFAERGQLHSSMLRSSTGTALEIVDGLKVAARNILMSPKPPASAYSPLLEKMPDRNAYGLFGLQAPSDPHTSLNLTGLGSFPVESSRRQEIDAALALEPIFRWVKGIYPEAPWVYYLSRQRFMCVYPYIPFDEFFMNDGFYDMDLFRRGTPENNPDRKPYITDVYVDEAGKGLMVTVGAPVYRGDEFMGIVGFDLTLESLSQSLRLGPLAGDSVYLVNDQAQIIASAGRKDVEEVLSLANAQVTTCGSVAEALRQFDAAPHGFDLVIADQTMPGGSGVDLIREIRKLNGDLPVFLHSGYPDAVNPQDVARYKITKVLLKPSTADELTRAINDAIGM